MSSQVMKALREKTSQELTEVIKELKTKLLEIRFSVASGDTEKAKNAGEIRKTIARILTILNEREREAQ